jgi:hypothetical protein
MWTLGPMPQVVVDVAEIVVVAEVVRQELKDCVVGKKKRRQMLTLGPMPQVVVAVVVEIVVGGSKVVVVPQLNLG